MKGLHLEKLLFFLSINTHIPGFYGNKPNRADWLHLIQPKNIFLKSLFLPKKKKKKSILFALEFKEKMRKEITDF